MTISYDTYKYPGKFDKTVTVSFGKGKKDAVVVHIVGFVNPIPMGILEVFPRKTIVKGLVNQKLTPVMLTIKNVGDAPMTVTEIKSRKFKKIYWQGQLTLSAGESSTVDFMIKPKKVGRFMDIIMVHSDARNDIGKGYKAVLVGETK